MRCPFCPCRGGALRKTNLRTEKFIQQTKNFDYNLFYYNHFGDFQSKKKNEQSKKSHEMQKRNLNSVEKQVTNFKENKNTEKRKVKETNGKIKEMQNRKDCEIQKLNSLNSESKQNGLEFDKLIACLNSGISKSVFNQNDDMDVFNQKCNPIEQLVSINQFEIEDEMEFRNQDEFGLKLKAPKLETDKIEQNDAKTLQNENSNNTKVDSKSNKQQNKANNLQNSQVPEQCYDSYRLDLNFEKEELKNEPLPEYTWIHMSCLYWIPELCFDNCEYPLEPKNIKGIDKEKYKTICSICNTNIGVCVKCVNEKCEIRFHVECARRANIHLEMIIEHNTKFNIHCHQHTTKLIYNLIKSEHRKTQEEVIKFYKYLQKFAKSNSLNIENNELIEIQIKDKIKHPTMNSLTELSEVTDIEKEHMPLNQKKKPDLTVVASVLTNQNKLCMSRVREIIWKKKEEYRFVINLKRIEALNDSFIATDLNLDSNLTEKRKKNDHNVNSLKIEKANLNDKTVQNLEENSPPLLKNETNLQKSDELQLSKSSKMIVENNQKFSKKSNDFRQEISIKIQENDKLSLQHNDDQLISVIRQKSNNCQVTSNLFIETKNQTTDLKNFESKHDIQNPCYNFTLSDKTSLKNNLFSTSDNQQKESCLFSPVLHKKQQNDSFLKKSVSSDSNCYAFENYIEPTKSVYKNIPPKKDPIWKYLDSNSNAKYHEKYKCCLKILKTIRKHFSEYFCQDCNGNLIKIKSYETGLCEVKSFENG